MEKELLKYKKERKTQAILYAILCAIVTVFLVLSFLEVIQPAAGGEQWVDAWNGFIAGFSTAVIALSVLGIILSVRAIKNEEYLKKQYIKEHDERTREISYRAGHYSYWFETLGLVLGAVVGGYFSPVVGLTCLGCILYICLVRIGLKLYYCKKL